MSPELQALISAYRKAQRRMAEADKALRGAYTSAGDLKAARLAETEAGEAQCDCLEAIALFPARTLLDLCAKAAIAVEEGRGVKRLKAALAESDGYVEDIGSC